MTATHITGCRTRKQGHHGILGTHVVCRPTVDQGQTAGTGDTPNETASVKHTVPPTAHSLATAASPMPSCVQHCMAYSVAAAHLAARGRFRRAHRAAALPVFPDTDGINFHGTTGDQAGRNGIALSVTSDNGGGCGLLILDPRTGEPLAFEMTAMHDPGRLGITEPSSWTTTFPRPRPRHHPLEVTNRSVLRGRQPVHDQ